MRAWFRPPAIDDRARGNSPPVCQSNAACIDRCGRMAGVNRVLPQFAAQRGIEIVRSQRSVARAQPAPVSRELYLVSVPFRFAEPRHQRGSFGAEIAFEPAPPVISAQLFARLDQGNLHFRVAAAQGKRNQPAGKPAADYGNFGSGLTCAPVHYLHCPRPRRAGEQCVCFRRPPCHKAA